MAIGLGRSEIIFLLLILVAAIAVRLAWTPDSLWYDEIASLKFAQQPYANLWSDWMRRETNPPLYYTVLRAWIGLFGSSDTALHGLSIVFGLVGIVAAWALARELGGRRAGLWAAVFTTLAPAQVMFSLQVRAYGLAYAAALVALLGAVMVLRASRLRAGLTLYAIGTTVALYAHTTMLLLPLIVNAYALGWFVTRRDRPVQLALAWLVTNAMVLLLWSWWLSITLWQMKYATNVQWLTRPTPIMAARWVFETYIPDSIGPIRLLVALLMTGLAAWAAWSGRWKATLLVGIAAAGVPLILYLLSFATPVIMPRTLFWASGPFIVLVALGVVGLPSRLAIAMGGILAVALGVGCVLSHRQATVEPWHAMVEMVSRADPQAVVVAGDPGVAFLIQHYCPRPACGLRIISVPLGEETGSIGLPRPEQRPLPFFGAMAVHHRLFSVTRLGRGDLTVVASPVARARNLGMPADWPDTMKLVEWTPIASSDRKTISRTPAAS